MAMVALRSARPASPALSDSSPECRWRLSCVADNADGHRFGQADPVRVDVDLDDLGLAWPVVDAIAGQGRKRVQAGAKGQHDIGLGDQLHPGFGAVIAQRSGKQRVGAGEGIIVLIATANRRVQAFGQRLESSIAPPMTTPAPFRMTGNLAFDNRSAASHRVLHRPGRSNSTICGRSISMTWVQKSRGMLICAGAEARLACRITRFRVSAIREGSRTSS